MYKACTVTGIILLLVLTVTPTVFSQTQTATADEWQVISNNGYINQTGDAKHLWSNGGLEDPGISLVKPINPTGDFCFQTQVYAERNESCCIFVRNNSDCRSYEGFNFEFGHYGANVFLLARNYSDWMITQVAAGEAHAWYTMQLNISKSPFMITVSVYSENGTCIGSLSTSDIVNFGFDDIKYIGLNVWGISPSDYYFKNIQCSLDNTGSSSLSIATTSSSSNAGATVNVYGALIDQVGLPLQNKTVVLAYTFAGLDEWIPISSAATDDQGRYSMQWINSASGTFTLKTQWSGDNSNSGCSNTTTLSFLPADNKPVFVFESNSTISALAFDNQTATLCFNATGPTGTTGYTQVTIAKSLLANSEDLKASIDGNQLNYTVTSTGGSWVYSFNYHHSTHQISMHLVESGTVAQPSGDEYILVAIIAVLCVTLGAIVYSVSTRKNRNSS